MNAARRSIKRRDWPRGLREPRPSYYTWEPPGGSITINGEVRTCLILGSIPLEQAREEALAANLYYSKQRPTLAQKLAGAADKTMADVLDLMPVASNYNTAKTNRSMDRKIRAAMGTKLCRSITTADCAELLREASSAGMARTAQALRSRMLAVFVFAQNQGYADRNPAEPTATEAPEVQRSRLSLEQFRAIYAVAPQVNEWLQQALAIALVTGADRSTISAMTRSQISADSLTIWRGKTKKTNRPIQIPLALRLDVMGWTLEEVLRRRTPVVSKFVLHHVRPYRYAPTGSAIAPNLLTRAFTEARKLAKIPDEIDDKGAPTFHEIRSLAKRLYTRQGGVDTKALLGHSTDEMAELYLDERTGIPEPIRVQLG